MVNSVVPAGPPCLAVDLGVESIVEPSLRGCYYIGASRLSAVNSMTLSVDSARAGRFDVICFAPNNWHACRKLASSTCDSMPLNKPRPMSLS